MSHHPLIEGGGTDHHEYHMQVKPYFILFLMVAAVAGCAALGGIQERYAVCAYDQVWEASLDSLKDREVLVKDREQGQIETNWLEIPMPGRTYGALQREIADSRDRSRLIVTLKRVKDVTKVSLAEERQRYGWRGGSRMFGWIPTDPSDEMIRSVLMKLEVKLKEHGCSLT